MKLLKQAMAVLGTVVVIAVIAALVTPKTAHALVATLVQVANTPANPVPTQAVPTATTLVTSQTLTLNDGGFTAFGPFDVSSYSSIRFLADPFSRNPLTFYFKLTIVDPSGNEIPLDTLTSTGGTVTTAVYPTPGTSLNVSVLALCASAPCDSSNTARFFIFGR